MNLIFQLFACFAAHGFEYKDQLVGPLYVAEIPASFTADDQAYCHKQLGKVPEGDSEPKMDTYQCASFISEAEPEQKQEQDQNQNQKGLNSTDFVTGVEKALTELRANPELVFLPREVRVEEPKTGCSLEQKFHFFSSGERIYFSINVSCPEGVDSEKNAHKALSLFFENQRPQVISVFSAHQIPGSELAKMETVVVPMVASECIAKLIPYPSGGFHCEIESGEELDEVNTHAGHKYLSLFKRWKFPSDKDTTVLAEIEFNPTKQKYYLRVVYDNYHPFSSKALSTVHSNIEVAFQKMGSLKVYVPMKLSASAKYETKNLNVYERKVKVDLQECFAAQHQPPWTGYGMCTVNSVAASGNLAFFSHTSTPGKTKAFSYQGETYTFFGRAFGSYYSMVSKEFGRDISYSILLQERFLEDRVKESDNPEVLRPMFEDFARTYPELSFMIAK